jgi:predicted DNA-binding antitoxin AbrB/MazE fold protein
MITVVRLVEAHFENGVLRPVERLGLRPGERVQLIVMRDQDPTRWDLARLTETGLGDDLPLAEQGLAEWVNLLEAAERS